MHMHMSRLDVAVFRAFFLLTPDHWLRKRAIRLARSKNFESVVLLLIAVNCLLLAMTDPTQVRALPDALCCKRCIESGFDFVDVTRDGLSHVSDDDVIKRFSIDSGHKQRSNV